MTQPLRIIYPYAGERHPLTIAGAPPEAEWFDVSSDPHAYHRLMVDVWADAIATNRGVVVIEHDIVCRPDIIQTFATDPDPWLMFPYRSICCFPCMESWANSMGCTRYGADMIAAVPDAVSSITKPEHLNWANLCDGIGGNLRDAGYSHSWRYASVVHHHQGRNGPAEGFLTDTRIPNDTPKEIAAKWLPL